MQDFEANEAARDEAWRRDPELAKFNARIAMLISGTIKPLGDEMIPDDDPDGGEMAKLIPPDLPPKISDIALRPPEREPLVDLMAA